MGDSGRTAQSVTGQTENDIVTGILVLCQGENVPERIHLAGKIRTFGRAVNNDVVCNCLQISRKHASFEYVNDKWFLRDMSTNGLSINGRKIDKGVVSELSHNDVILFIPTGTLQYRFEYIDRNIQPNAANVTNNILRPISALQEPNERIAPPQILDIDDDSLSNHSESLLDARDIIECSSSSVTSVPNNDSGFNGMMPCLRNSSPLKTVQYCNQQKLKLNKETRVKRPHANFDEPGSSSAKRKFITEDPKEVEQDLPDIDDSAEELDIQELPDIDEPLPLPLPKKAQLKTQSKDIMMCNDLATLRRQYLECVKKLEGHEAATQIQLIEKDIQYQKLLDQCNEAESKAEVQKEEIFKLVMDAMEREFGCCICNEIFIQATVIECGHTFCNFCVTEWQRRNPECPICRAGVKNPTKHNEVENFIVMVHTFMSPEIQNKRELAIQERGKAIEKAEVDHAAAARGRRGAIGDLSDHNILEFLSDMRMFRIREASRPTRRGNGRGTAASNRRSTRLQNQVGDAAAVGPMLGRRGGRPRRAPARREPPATATAPSAAGSNTAAAAASARPIPSINIGPLNIPSVPNIGVDQQAGPSRFMGFLGLVQRAAASTNLFSSNPINPTASATVAAAPSAAGNAPLAAQPSERIAPRLSDSVVLLSSDDDLELIDEALGVRRPRRSRAAAPLSINFFANPDYNSSASSDDDY